MAALSYSMASTQELVDSLMQVPAETAGTPHAEVSAAPHAAMAASGHREDADVPPTQAYATQSLEAETAMPSLQGRETWQRVHLQATLPRKLAILLQRLPRSVCPAWSPRLGPASFAVRGIHSEFLQASER